MQNEPRSFHPATNSLAKLFIVGLVLICAVAGWALHEIYDSPFVTRAGIIEPQPVMFSHKHHVADDGIDCRVCHTTVEKTAYAGVPPTEIGWSITKTMLVAPCGITRIPKNVTIQGIARRRTMPPIKPIKVSSI